MVLDVSYREKQELLWGIGIMTLWHRMAAYAATLVGLALLAGALFGWNYHLNAFGSERTVRDVSVALYSFLVPVWFTLERECWEPDKKDSEYNRFKRGQRIAQAIWIAIGGLIGIIIGIGPKLSG